ncbi:exocyst complex component, sec3 subunit [Pholiota conissans]|uniref:Exocyst complex component, sec3 subunit n=1 Tax=Pholiota conissans TaxID=109636 RepID=A0A9P5Z437_9AGAR|nr:exocyst complex component, sec3 subunit [Pholiota conissans]
MADQRQRIIASVFSRRNAEGNLEETYVSHIKIWEDAGPEGGGRKPRYILLSQASNGSGFLHKSKKNTNDTFSVGKTWRLAELRKIEVVNPFAFNLTLARTYRWQTENQDDQANFLEALIRLFRVVSGPQAPLQLEASVEFPQRASKRPGRTPSPTGAPQRPPRTQATRIQNVVAEVPQRTPSPASVTNIRSMNGNASRSGSPAGPTRERRPPSITVPVPPPPAAPLSSQRPSNQTNGSSARIPSSNLERTPSRVPQESNRILAPNRADNSSPTPSARSRAGTSRVENILSNSATEANALRRDQNTRISYFDPANQATLDRLILPDSQADADGEEENAQATLINVEEMIEGYEWASDDVVGKKMTRGAVDMIEARLLDELNALEKANIHSFLESDDRVSVVMKFMDDALAELDNMDSLISTYKIHLNAVNEDILYIQSQNRGLQVQNQNQRALLSELQNLLRTVHVDQEALATLTQESLEKSQSISRLEEAAVQLYKALQAGRDTDMAATMERLQEYRTYNSQFCKRVFDFLSIMVVARSKMLLGDTSGLTKSPPGPRPTALLHDELEAYLSRYIGLLLYMREMDENIYSKLCAAYFSSASDLHGIQMKALMSGHLELVRKVADEEFDQGFGTTVTPLASKGATGMRRAGTIIRSPIESRQREKERRQQDGDMRASEVFGLFLEQIANLIYREDAFVSDFLQINDSGFTFADYIGLDNYFRRQAARSASLSQNTTKLIRGALDLIFGFLPAELKAWLDAALIKDGMELIGILAFLERFILEAEERGNPFVINLLEKQHSRLKVIFDRHISDQLKNIERTKLSSKKRKGVTHFVKYFSAYTSRVESQLVGANNLEIRTSVDAAYEKIVQSMFDSLKQIAKLEGEGEDKGQLNYHVILIENMHYFVSEISQMDVPSLNGATRRAQAIYDENVAAYVKIVFRRPFGKIIDFFEALDRVAKGVNPSELASNSNFNKAALKKIIKDYNSKDIRKYIDVLAKRVEKHFTDAEKATAEENNGVASGKVLLGVWNSCEEEFVKLTEAWASRISQLYSDSGVALEYTTTEVESSFRRQKFGS